MAFVRILLVKWQPPRRFHFDVILVPRVRGKFFIMGEKGRSRKKSWLATTPRAEGELKVLSSAGKVLGDRRLDDLHYVDHQQLLRADDEGPGKAIISLEARNQ